MQKPLNPYVQLHGLIVIWAFTAILGRLIHLSALEIVVYRTLIATLGMWMLVYWNKLSLNVSARSIAAMTGVGALIALHWITFFLAARLSNISICLAGLATTSFWTSIIEPLVNRKKIQWYEPILGLLSMAGIMIIFETVYDRYIGLILAVISALLAAVFIIYNGLLIKHHHHHVISFYQMLGAFLTSVLVIPVFGVLMNESFSFDVSLMDWVYLFILGTVCTVFAYSHSVKLMEQLSAFAVNLTVNLEPVYGIILAVLFFRSEEKMSVSFYLGASLVLISILIYPILQKRLSNSLK